MAKWTALRIVEVILVLACLVFKRVTDDEARSLFLYLQKLSREWSLLTNVTWDRVGSSVADATYGGYLIITSALLIGKLFKELPTERRITEWVLLGTGAILFIVLGSLSYAAIDSVPPDLIDNAAILGTLSVVTGALFLLDMGAPKAKRSAQAAKDEKRQKNNMWHVQNGTDNGGRGERSITDQVYDIEREVERSEEAIKLQEQINGNEQRAKTANDPNANGIGHGGYRNGRPSSKTDIPSKELSIFPGISYIHLDPTNNGYRQMKEEEFDIPRRFGIYGKDVTDHDSETDETASIPPKIEFHPPVWSQIRKGEATKYNISPIVLPEETHQEVSARPPSSPLDPGYVQYTAEHWGETKRVGTKTPRHSPTEV